MDWLGSIASGAISLLAGGATGLIGGVVTKVAEYKSKQLDADMARDKMAHDLEMKKADAAIMQQEYASRIQVAQAEAAGQEAVSDSQAFQASLTSEPSRYSDAGRLTPGQEWLMVILDTVRGLVRPVLTVYLCAITTLVYLQARTLIGPGAATLTPEQAVDLVRLIVNTVLYLTSSCVLWWFGSRNKGKAPG